MVERAAHPDILPDETIKKEAKRTYKALDSSIKDLLEYEKHIELSPGEFVWGNNDHFIYVRGVGTNSLHLVQGKTPLKSVGSHRHIGIRQLLRLRSYEPKSVTAIEAPADEKKKEEEIPKPDFDAWEVGVTVGDNNSFYYVSHKWEKGKLMTSPSANIQDNNSKAITGIEELLPHLSD